MTGQLIYACVCILWIFQYVLAVAPEFIHHLMRHPQVVAKAAQHSEQVIPGLLIVAIEIKEYIGIRNDEAADE